MIASAGWVARYAAGAALVVLASAGRPLAWTAIGLALVAGALCLAAPRELRRRSAPLALGLAIIAILAVAPAIAQRL